MIVSFVTKVNIELFTLGLLLTTTLSPTFRQKFVVCLLDVKLRVFASSKLALVASAATTPLLHGLAKYSAAHG
jgi:hypothetical protein